MKWFAILLSIYLIVLSGIPCADAASAADTLGQTSINADSHSTGHSPAADLCSPLCICTCCAGFALQTATQKVSPAVFKITIPAPAYVSVAVSYPSFSIWQPPKH